MPALADALAGGAPVLPLDPTHTPDRGAPHAERETAAVEQLKQTVLPPGTAVVVRTSGSTGTPKSVALSAEALLTSAHATHEAFGGAGQWLVALPAHLISGLQMLVRSAASGIDPVFCDDFGDPAALIDVANTMSHDRRYVSLVPVQLARLLDLAEYDLDAADTLRRFDAVLVGGQAVSLDLRTRAHELGVTLRRSYGMTETSGGCVYDGVEIGDTRVRIRGGEVQLAGACLALEYVDDPDLTADRFVTDVGLDGEPVRWFRTGDAGELLGGMLTVTGRLDRVIISGGVNVSLDEIERVTRELPGWSSAVALSSGVVGRTHPEWGEQPVLVVETEGDAAPFDRVREVVRAALGPAATPIWVNEAETLPRLSGGKPDLPKITEWLQTVSDSFTEVQRAQNEAKRMTEEGRS